MTAVLSTLAVSLLVGCNNTKSSDNPTTSERSIPIPLTYEEDEEPLEIGDTVKEWTHIIDYSKAPLDIPSSAAGTGNSQIVNDFGHLDLCSLKYVAKIGNNQQGYLSSDALEEP